MKMRKFGSYGGLLVFSLIAVSICFASSWADGKKALTIKEMGSVYGGCSDYCGPDDVECDPEWYSGQCIRYSFTID